MPTIFFNLLQWILDYSGFWTFPFRVPPPEGRERDTDSMLKTQCEEWRGNELSAELTVVHSYYISEPSEQSCTSQCGSAYIFFMQDEIRILDVESDAGDGVIVTFSDGTIGGYVVEELLELRPYREPIRKQHANRAPSGSGECASA